MLDNNERYQNGGYTLQLPFENCHDNCALDTLAMVAKILATQTNQQKMLKDVLNLLENSRGMFHCSIMLSSADGRELFLEAETTGKADDHARYRKGEGIPGRVLESGKTVIVPKVSKEPNFQFRIHSRQKSDQREVSFICVPIRLENQIIGTLSVDHIIRDRGLLEESAQLLEIVATLIASDAGMRRFARAEREILEAENRRLRLELGDHFQPGNMIGESSQMQAVFDRVKQVSMADTTVLIRGESGTGKELIASAIHYNSARKDNPLIKVNCAALSESLLESELFGHEKGAFTGAVNRRRGRIEEAEGGTLFLDELGDFTPAIQVKLLRVIQEREYERVGSNLPIKANVRIVAATNRNLEDLVRDGRFREDLYYRINVFPIVLPPLRQRRSDILLLANHFTEKLSAKTGKQVKRISTTAINMLMAYHWPGNVRELENSIEHAVLLCTDGVIFGRHLPPTLQIPTENDTSCNPGGLKSAIDQLEKDMIIDSLKRNRGNIAAAARELQITGRMVRYKIEKLGISFEKIPKRSLH